MRESLKQLNKKAKAIRKETAKQSEVTRSPQKTKSATKKQVQIEEPVEAAEEPKKAATKKQAKETKKAPQKDQQKKKSQTIDKQPTKAVARQEEEEEESSPVQQQRGKQQRLTQTIAAEPEKLLEKKVFNASEGVRASLRDPESAFKDQASSSQYKVEFREAPQTRQSLRFKEAPGHETQNERLRASQLSFGKVESLPTLIKDLQNNEKLREKINEDMGGALDVNPM